MHSSLITKNILTYTIIVICLILVIYIIITLIYYDNSERLEQYLADSYNSITDEQNSDAAKKVIDINGRLVNKRPIDHYRTGTVLLVNAQQPNLAYEHYYQALRQIQNGNDNLQNLYVIDRINDYKTRFDEDLPIQEALVAYFERQHNKLHENNTPVEILENKKKTWTNDPHNVHDTLVNDSIEAQYTKLVDDNIKNPNNQLHDYKEAKKWLINKSKETSKENNNTDHKEKMEKIINMLDNNFIVRSINANEQDLVIAVWQRIHDSNNVNNYDNLCQAFYDAAIDCVPDSVVCQDGRMSRFINSLAKLDYNDNIGILKTKQMIRSEIYEAAGEIVNNYISNIQHTNKELYNNYIADADTDDVKQIRLDIIDEIELLKKEYANKLPDDQLELIINECKDTI